MLTQDKFTEYKKDYKVYKYTATTDQYGGRQRSYEDRGDTINVMWTPITDEASVAQYGDRISQMLQCVIYEGDVEAFDRIKIDDDMYQVESVMPYNTHLLVRVAKV